MESAENQLDVKNLIAKVDFVLPDGKIIYSTEKIYLRHENSKYKINKGSDECLKKSLELADANGEPTRFSIANFPIFYTRRVRQIKTE